MMKRELCELLYEGLQQVLPTEKHQRLRELLDEHQPEEMGASPPSEQPTLATPAQTAEQSTG